jgi:RNA polymerase sigma factor for flagellar operon FliA
MATISLDDIWSRFKVGGDPRAREALIDNYGYLVKITAGRIAGGVPPSLDREDLISAGLIGLIKAVDQYDCNRQVKFETYAIALIRGAILELLRGEDWAPRSVRDRIKQLERTYAMVESRLGRPGTDEEIAAELDVDLDTFHRMLSEVGQASVLSLDDLLFTAEPEGTLRLQDTLEDRHSDTSLAVEIRERTEHLRTAMDRLPDREKLVLSLYYYEGMTFKEIGKILQVSESRVFQLHQQAMMRLRGHLAADRELFVG